MPYLIGIMLGRLSTPAGRELQTFPWATWREEFRWARQIGFDHIEWLVDGSGFEQNPMLDEQGQQLLRATMADTGLHVGSICAHYFIVGGLSSTDQTVRTQAVMRLTQLMEAAKDAGVGTIVLPLAESASLEEAGARGRAIASLASLPVPSSRPVVRLALELDLDAARSIEVLRALGREDTGLCYDVGNATAAGLAPADEIPMLAPYLLEVHIKDRKVGGPNVLLGHGAVDFGSVRDALQQSGYTGPLVLETPRGEVPQTTAATHLALVRRVFCNDLA